MRPWNPMLAVLAGAVALGCSTFEVATTGSPDAGTQPSNAPNGTYRCDGEHAQQLDVLGGQWVEAGDCALRGGSGSVLHWNGAGLSAGSAVLPGEPRTDQRRILAGARNDAWWVSGREELWTQHAMLFHWDGTWWTELYDWERFAPSGVVSDPSGGAWVFGSRQTFTGQGAYVTSSAIVHVAPTLDRWEETMPAQIGSGGHIVDMHATSDGAVWAVGQRPVVGEAVVTRRMGSVWHGTPFYGGAPSSVWAESGLDAWVTTSGVAVFHWDGAAWTNTWHEGYGTSRGRLRSWRSRTAPLGRTTWSVRPTFPRRTT